MAARRPQSLRMELLFQLGFLASSAVLLTGLATAFIARFGIEESIGALVVLWMGSSVVFVLFAHHLVRRMLLRPLETLAVEATALEGGALPAGTPAYESQEFAQLAERYRRMATSLLDVNSQIVRVEKLAGVGQLAAGVAHEIRNPLGALHTYVEVLRRRGTDAGITQSMAAEIERIEHIVRGLLDYSRPGPPTGSGDLNEVLAATIGFLSDQGALRGVTLALDLAETPQVVRGDRHALEQVVVNLLLNARDATPNGHVTAGTVFWRYEAHPSAQRRTGEPVPAVPGVRLPRPRRMDLAPGAPGVLLFVADDGPGVPATDRERVFDPFYTTKAPGAGTGLGLAIVARTVHDLGGIVWVDRAREGGAVFKIFLPLAGEA
jgi:two-component system NtrC family sensor kinase